MKLSIFEGPQEDKPMLALLLLLVAVSILSLQDSAVKLIAPMTSFWQLQIVRSIFNLLIAFALAVAAGGLHLLWPSRLGPAVARGVLLAMCMLCFFGASQQITISQMATGLYTYPLFITLLAGPVLGERIGPWRIGALGLGAFGCVLVLEPFGAAFSGFQLVPVMAGFFYACNVLVLRRYCRNESPLALASIVALVFIVTGSAGAVILEVVPVSASWQQAVPFVFIGWPVLTLTVVGLLALMSVLNLFGNLLLSRAYQTADSSWLAPLDFVYLLFAAMWGRVLFDSWPTPLAAFGMAMIAAAGIVTAVREQQRQRQLRPEPEPDARPAHSRADSRG
jgi:drug/metabolite transporter (DMT)-like permease